MKRSALGQKKLQIYAWPSYGKVVAILLTKYTKVFSSAEHLCSHWCAPEMDRGLWL